MGIRTHTGTDSDTSISNLLQLESIKKVIDSLLAKRHLSGFKSSYIAIKKPYTNVC